MLLLCCKSNSFFCISTLFKLIQCNGCCSLFVLTKSFFKKHLENITFILHCTKYCLQHYTYLFADIAYIILLIPLENYGFFWVGKLEKIKWQNMIFCSCQNFKFKVKIFFVQHLVNFAQS